MSIVQLERVTFAGLSRDKAQLLEDLQRLGCVEIIPCSTQSTRPVAGGSSGKALAALKFLLTCPQRRVQVTDPARFKVSDVGNRALELQDTIHRLSDERDEILLQLSDLEPWGDFTPPSANELGGLRLACYCVPRKDVTRLEQSGVAWQVIALDPKTVYVAVLSEAEPADCPGEKVTLGPHSHSQLQQRLEEVELAIEDAQAERAYLTRWCLLFARNLTELEDSAAQSEAAKQTFDNDPLFALEAWAPRDRCPELGDYARKHQLAFDCRPPGADDRPPTLMHNSPRTSAGEDLVNFYMTPGYWAWDPSSIVFVSFAVFFAMILADAGYATLLGLGLLLAWRWLGRSPSSAKFRPLLVAIVVLSLGYGVVVGSYFGITPSPGSRLSRLHILDMSNSGLMMGLSILVGGVHVILANVMDARRYVDWRDGLASIGWALVVGGALFIAAAAVVAPLESLKFVGFVGVGIGLALVVGFTARHEKPPRRLLQGLLGLTKVSSAFGDVLSYLRLFALGLASASLAVAFNDMAAGIRTGLPRIGLILAIVVLVFGHALNLLLGISSGVIHGLRLNVIEFFNWGLKDEGRRFTPFRRTETLS